MSRTRTRQADAAVLAHTAERMGTGPAAVKKLIRLSDRAYRANERQCNSGCKTIERLARLAQTAVESYAAALGLATMWPGLHPAFVTGDGCQVHLPD